jgi:hypothetical protein
MNAGESSVMAHGYTGMRVCHPELVEGSLFDGSARRFLAALGMTSPLVAARAFPGQEPVNLVFQQIR